MSLEDFIQPGLEPVGFIDKGREQRRIIRGLNSIDVSKRIRKEDLKKLYIPTLIDDSEFSYQPRTSIYSRETNSKLEDIGFNEEVDRNRIALAYSDRLSKRDFPRGDYFKKVLRLHDFADEASFIATMETIARKGIPKFEKMINRTNDLILFSEDHYKTLIRKSIEVRNPFIKDVIDSRIYLTDKFIWGQDIEPNRLHLNYH